MSTLAAKQSRRPSIISRLTHRITGRAIWLTLGALLVIGIGVILEIISQHHQFAACTPVNRQSCTDRAQQLEGSVFVSVLFAGHTIYVLSNRVYLLVMFRLDNREILRLPKYDPENPRTMLDRIEARMSPSYLAASSEQLKCTLSVAFYCCYLALWLTLCIISYHS